MTLAARGEASGSVDRGGSAVTGGGPLIAGGCSVKAVQRALGHASAATTLNLYAHMWPGDDDRIRQAVDRAFGSDAEDQLRTGTQDQ